MQQFTYQSAGTIVQKNWDAFVLGPVFAIDRSPVEMNMLRWIQGKTRKDRIRNARSGSDAMVKPKTTYVTQKRISLYI